MENGRSYSGSVDIVFKALYIEWCGCTNGCAVGRSLGALTLSEVYDVTVGRMV